MRTSKQMAWIAGGVVAAAGAMASAGTTGFYKLGSGFTPTGISDNGVVAGTSDALGGYFTWTASGGAVNIGGVLPEGYGGQASISNDGTRVGGTNINTATGRGEMAYYDITSASWTNLGGIGSSSDNSTSSGWGISGDGQHMVGLGWINAGTAHAIQWSAGTGTVDMGSTVTDRSTRANAVSDNGSVVVGWQDDDFGFRQGAVWVNGVQTTISDNDGNPMGEASSVSGDGQWVTGITSNDRSWRYNTVSEDFEYLDPIGSGYFFPTALGTGISDDGSIIVGQVRDFGPPVFGNGFIWQEGVGTMSLNDYFDSMGVDYEDGFVFSAPFAVSGDGDTFAGWGLDGNGALSGWVVTVPSPAGLGLFGLGGLAVARRRR